MAAQYPQRMSGGQRLAVLLIFGALWLSGCYWLLLHYSSRSRRILGPRSIPGHRSYCGFTVGLLWLPYFSWVGLRPDMSATDGRR